MPSYKDVSSESEDDFQDVESSFNETLEDNTVDGARREIKNRNNPAAVEQVTNLLGACKVESADNYQLDGSTIVYVDSDEEVVEEGFIADDSASIEVSNPPPAIAAAAA